eukprot:scaffold620_cov177-Ochromonas_danica.AAC.23
MQSGVNKKDSMLNKTGPSSNANTTKKRRKPTLTVAKKGSVKKKDKPTTTTAAAQSKAGRQSTLHSLRVTLRPSSTLCFCHSCAFMRVYTR